MAPTVLIVAQAGRLGVDAVLFAASLRDVAPDAPLVVAEPQPGPLWPRDPRLPGAIRTALRALGARIVPLHSTVFGAAYPYGNKIEALSLLPHGQPFAFFDSDTLILDDPARVPFDFARPAASLRREDTWPVPRADGPDRAAIWAALYAQAGLDFAASLDTRYGPDDWRRYLYFNAGFFAYRCPQTFGAAFLRHATAIRDAPPAALRGQSLDPWLDQVALPLAVHELGGGRDSLPPGWIDERTSCHYRALPLLYAREADATVALFERLVARADIAALLPHHPPIARFVAEGMGPRIRALFDRSALPGAEAAIRKRIKAAGLWLR